MALIDESHRFLEVLEHAIYYVYMLSLIVVFCCMLLIVKDLIN